MQSVESPLVERERRVSLELAAMQLVVGTWKVVVSSAHSKHQEGSVVLRFEPDGSERQLLGYAVDQNGEIDLKHVEFDPSTASLQFEQRGLPDRPKVVWSCTVADGALDAGKILENSLVVAHFQGRRDQNPLKLSQRQQSPRSRSLRRFPSKPCSRKSRALPEQIKSAPAPTLHTQESRSVAESTDANFVLQTQPTSAFSPTQHTHGPRVVDALTDAQMLVNLERDNDLAVVVFPFTLEDEEMHTLPTTEMDKLIALHIFHAIIDRELLAGVPPSLIQLQRHIADTEAIVDDEFQTWLERSHSHMAMFGDVIESVRLQWVANKEKIEAEKVENSAIIFVEQGGVLAMYNVNGTKKCDKRFAASVDTCTLTWDNPSNKGSFRWSSQAQSPTTMTIFEVQSSVQMKSAHEWFATADVGGDGVLDSSQISTLYLRARGETLSSKKMQAAMAVMDPHGRGTVACDDFVRWWTDSSSDLDKQRELAFTVTVHQPSDDCGKFQLILVAPNRDAKANWVEGLGILCKRKRKLDAEREEAALVDAKKRFTRPQVREMARKHLQQESRDPNVSDAWIDGLFDQFAASQSKTIDIAAWHSIVEQLNHRKMLNRAQVRKMVRLQLHVDGKAPKESQYTTTPEASGSATRIDDWIDSVFDQFDADGSGMIEEREWKQLLLMLEKQSVWLI